MTQKEFEEILQRVGAALRIFHQAATDAQHWPWVFWTCVAFAAIGVATVLRWLL